MGVTERSALCEGVDRHLMVDQILIHDECMFCHIYCYTPENVNFDLILVNDRPIFSHTPMIPYPCCRGKQKKLFGTKLLRTVAKPGSGAAGRQQLHGTAPEEKGGHYHDEQEKQSNRA